jgi:hypothetical protein
MQLKYMPSQPGRSGLKQQQQQLLHEEQYLPTWGSIESAIVPQHYLFTEIMFLVLCVQVWLFD